MRLWEEGAMILILDDHPLSRQGISSLLMGNQWEKEIHEAGTVKESMSIMKKEAIDLAFVDINLGCEGENGFDFIRWIKKEHLDTKVFVITSSSRHCDFQYAQELDVDAYVLKDAFIDEITYGLKAVERGSKFYSSALLEKLNRVSADEKAIHSLTPRELDVLSLIGEGETNESISKTLYISPGTVKKHVTSILSKLELVSRVDAVIFANKNSYILQNAIEQCFRPDERRG